MVFNNLRNLVKMTLLKILAVAGLICCTLSSEAYAQGTLQGVIFRKGSSTRVSNTKVYNKSSGYTILTDKLGLFTIAASQSDTLLITHSGYLDQEIIVTDYRDLFVYLQPSTLLSEVTIRGETLEEGLKEVRNSYRSKGIYYKGKPPIWLLLPFGGSPVTFFYELFSKDGKRARRFERFAGNELDYYAVAKRFNNTSIKSIVPIADTELEAFKSAYWPKTEQFYSWSEFDLLKYIKKSYEEFKKTSITDSTLAR